MPLVRVTGVYYFADHEMDPDHEMGITEKAYLRMVSEVGLDDVEVVKP